MQFLKIHLLMLLCAVLVAGSFPVVASISHELDPVLLTLLRFLLASFLFAPLIWFRYGFKVSLAALGRYSVISATLVICFWSMFFSLRYTTALNISAIFTLVPSLSGLYAMVLNRERLGRTRLIALVLGLIGALWIVFKGELSIFTELSLNKGDLIFFVGCLFMGLYTPLVRLFHRNEPMPVMAFWVMVTGSLWLLLLAGSQLTTISFTDIPDKLWMGLLYVAIFSTIISFFITQYAILFLGPTRVMAYSYLYPALVLFLDFLLKGTIPELKILPGVVIVLSAMFVVQHRKNNS
ncbi:MAG TPA: DMT family transporter [Desulfobacterales bacterium]|nr:DMT family transporter [Desulfobacterales bacterium]HIP40011.1 DMT family transporter [Desulfocapsa sulfexigens]